MHGLTLIESGGKEVKLNGALHRIEKEHAVFFSQGNYFTNQNTPDYRALTIFFDDSYILQLIRKHTLPIPSQSSGTLVLSFGSEEKIVRLTQNIVSTHAVVTPQRNTLLTLQIELLILELYTAFPKTGTFFRHILDTSGERMRYILESNIDILHTVSDMQKLLRVGTTAFHKHFRRQFGISPKSWLDTQRMKKAMFLLTSTDKSITEIATECGYATASWFIVQFKKYCKTTPKAYREKNRYK
jgi:AraC-like DNA-binding protein